MTTPEPHNALPRLINMSARLRMLSHRICLFLLLVDSAADAASRERHRQTLGTAMTEFESIFHTIVEGRAEAGKPTLELAAVRTYLQGGTPAPAEDIRHFVQTMQKLAARAGQGDAKTGESIHALAEFTSVRLLSVLDQLTLAFQSEAAQMQRAQLQRVAQSLEELDMVNKTTLLISFNAKVEAMRAGAAGRAFAAIADEIQRLAKQTQGVASHLRVTTTKGTA